MTTIYLIIAIVALCSIIGVMWKISAMTKKRLKADIKSKEKAINDLRDLVLTQEDEIRKYKQMVETLQEIEIEHVKKSKKLRTSDPAVNVRNASDIMRDLQSGDNNKDG